MASMKDKFLSAQRSQVRSCFWGKVNVFYSLLLFNIFDLVILIYFWYLHHLAVRDFDCSSFRDSLIVNTFLCLVSMISLIRGDLFFYSSIFLYLVRFWHICHIIGKVFGLLIFNVTRLSKTFQVSLYSYYVQRLLVFSSSTTFVFLRIIFILISVWYALVLQRIRVSGGTGFEKKTAEEFEMEAIDRYLADRERGSNGIQVEIM